MSASTWRPLSYEVTDEMWEVIRDLFEWPPLAASSKIGRPRKWSYRQLVEATFYVVVTGCQWRNLPSSFPHWNTAHRYHLQWSNDGTWEAACDRLVALERQRQGRDAAPSGAVVDARTVKGASTVCGVTRGFDGGKRLVGRKLFGVVDTLGLLLAVVVVAANVSDNAGGITVMGRAKHKVPGLRKLWADDGFKKSFLEAMGTVGVTTETILVRKLNDFVVQPRRWVVERTFGWLVNNRRLRTDYERTVAAAEGFVYAAHALMLLKRITSPSTA